MLQLWVVVASRLVFTRMAQSIVFQAGAGQLSVLGGAFVNNTQLSMTEAGGALEATGGSTTINCTSVQFSANTGVAGGAVANSDAIVMFNNCTFTANQAISGGALLVYSGKVTISGGTLRSNTKRWF